ncbi:MAG: hypothetical protein WCK77_11130 [Verrucomicrobiota bacterium]
MKTQYLFIAVSLGAWLCGDASAQKKGAAAPIPAPQAETVPSTAVVTAPTEVVAAAVAAVDKLGSEVTRGNYAVAIERMNPLWKERLAGQTPGGMAEIVKQIEGASKRMTQEGVSIISSVHLGTPRSFEVGPGTKVEKVKGKDVETQIFTKWLVFVPTLTKYRYILTGDAKPFYYIEKVGFQVAVSDKGKNDWTFIDGSGLTLNTLRRLYVTLPRDLELPPIEERKAADPR